MVVVVGGHVKLVPMVYLRAIYFMHFKPFLMLAFAKVIVKICLHIVWGIWVKHWFMLYGVNVG